MKITTYRQRFTTAGLIGCALFIVGPAIFGWLLSGYLTSLPNSRPSEVLLALSATLAPIGFLLILAGREYYDATLIVDQEAEVKKNLGAIDAEKRKASGI